MVLVRSPRRAPVVPPRPASPGVSVSSPSTDRFVIPNEFRGTEASEEGQASPARARDCQVSCGDRSKRCRPLAGQTVAAPCPFGAESPCSPSRLRVGLAVSDASSRAPYSLVSFPATSDIFSLPGKTRSRAGSNRAESEGQEESADRRGGEGVRVSPREGDRQTVLTGGARVKSRRPGEEQAYVVSPRFDRKTWMQEDEVSEGRDFRGRAATVCSGPSVSASAPHTQGVRVSRAGASELPGTSELSTSGTVAGCGFRSKQSPVLTGADAAGGSSSSVCPAPAAPIPSGARSAQQGERVQEASLEHEQRGTAAEASASPSLSSPSSSSGSCTTQDFPRVRRVEALRLPVRSGSGTVGTSAVLGAALLPAGSPSKKLRSDFQALRILEKSQRDWSGCPDEQIARPGGTLGSACTQASANSSPSRVHGRFSAETSAQQNSAEKQVVVGEATSKNDNVGGLFARTSGTVEVHQETSVSQVRRSAGSSSRTETSPCAQVETLAKRLPPSRALQEYVHQAAVGGAGRGQKTTAAPKTAQEFLEEWSPLVDATVQRLCDMTEEQKQVTRYIMLEGRMLRAVRHASSALTRRRAGVSVRHAEAVRELDRQRALYEDSEREFDVVQRHAEDAAGGQEKLERRLKDTQRKREKVEAYRHRMHEKMSALSFARQKKIRLAEALATSKKESNNQEKAYQGIHQLLRQVTRFVVNRIEGGVVTGALVPDEDLVPPRLLQKRRMGNNGGAMPLTEQENFDTRNAEPAMLTIDCEKDKEGGMDADYLWKLIEETLGIDGVTVGDLLGFATNKQQATGRIGGERRKSGKEGFRPL